MEAQSFATVDDLKERWPDFPTGGDAHAGTLLADASQFILDVCPGASRASASTLRRVVCSVVRRSMQSAMGGAPGIESQQLTAGPFSASYRPTNPHGDFYLTKLEKKSLGCGRQQVFGARIAGAPVRHWPTCDLMFGGATCSCGALLQGA